MEPVVPLTRQHAQVVPLLKVHNTDRTRLPPNRVWHHLLLHALIAGKVSIHIHTADFRALGAQARRAQARAGHWRRWLTRRARGTRTGRCEHAALARVSAVRPASRVILHTLLAHCCKRHVLYDLPHLQLHPRARLAALRRIELVHVVLRTPHVLRMRALLCACTCARAELDDGECVEDRAREPARPALRCTARAGAVAGARTVALGVPNRTDRLERRGKLD